MEKLRVDKWLWAVRFFKTRTSSTKACDAGRVKKADEKLKASSKIAVDEILTCRINHIQRTLVVKKLIGKRVGAPIAQECYEDLTPPEDLIIPKLKSAFLVPNAYREKGLGRPTKKDRRDIDRYEDLDSNLEEN